MLRFLRRARESRKVNAKNSGGTSPWSAVWSFTTARSSSGRGGAAANSITLDPLSPSRSDADGADLKNSAGTEPVAFSLSQNYPNPFNPSTTIRFTLPHSAVVSLRIYDILGREVSLLLNRAFMSPGVHETTFDASELSSGMYFYRLNAELAGDRWGSVRQMFLVK